MQKNENFRLESASTHGENGGDLEASGPGRVLEIRKQWVVHEDEALAYRLQNEEINSFYSGNRVRNGVLREDIPFTKEMQEKEEKEALEQRMKYLNVLQMQADEDAKMASELKLKYDRLRSSELEVDFDCLTEVGAGGEPENKRQPPEINRSSSSNCSNSFGSGATGCSSFKSNNASSNHINPGKNTPNIPSKLKPILNTKNCTSTTSSINTNVNVAMAQVQTSSPKAGCSYSSSNSNNNYPRNHEIGVEFQSFEPLAIPPPKEFCTLGKINKQFEQLEKDAEIARMLQEELEKEEMERLKIEAKDRELAQILHNKEKAKIQRAKERSRLKAAATSSSQESANDSQSESQSPEGLINPNSTTKETNKTPSIRNSSRSSSIASGGGERETPTPTPPTCSIEDTGYITPPKIPEKSQKKQQNEQTLGFKANPKRLPPNPQSTQSTTYNYNNLPQSPKKNDNYPVPPYMPLQGIKVLKKKK